MINIAVKYFAPVSEWLGCREEVLSLVPVKGQAITARQVLAGLAEKHGGAFAASIYDPVSGKLQEDLFILLNGRHLVRLQGLDTPVADQDWLAIVPVAEAG